MVEDSATLEGFKRGSSAYKAFHDLTRDFQLGMQFLKRVESASENENGKTVN